MNKTVKESLQFVVGAMYTAKDYVIKGIDELKKEEVLDENKSKTTFKKKARKIKNKIENLTKKQEDTYAKSTN